MDDKNTTVVVGLGEVGKPLFELVSQYHDAVGVDIQPIKEIPPKVGVLHICIPFAIKDFVGETIRYIEMFRPAVTVVNSTVSVGTTRAIAERSGTPVANSPIRGKHAKMLSDLRHYVKFVGAIDDATASTVITHFESIGLRTKRLASPEATELAKLTETTYFGVLIAWAQEVERYCDEIGVSYDEVVSIYDEIKFFPPVKYVPGIIGGHCVMPNIEIILSRFADSKLLQAVKSSNVAKQQRECRKDESSKGSAELQAASSSSAR